MPAPHPNAGPRRRPAPQARTVRCLGPRDDEHAFRSPDPARVRICAGCRKAIEKLSFTRTRPHQLMREHPTTRSNP